MKHSTLIAACLLALLQALPAQAQEKALQIYRDGNVIQSYTVSTIDSIKFGEVISAPSSVSATIDGESVKVEWSAVPGARSYQLFRSGNNTSYTKLAEGLTSTSYTDTKPMRGQNYYKVKALGERLESTLSEASASVVYNDEGIESGLYLGIVGFNQELTKKNINILAPNTKSSFTDFVDGLGSKNGTLLYYAVDNGIDMLTSTALPRDIINTAIVTFTDGLDQGSMMMNADYQTDTEYLNALQQRIQNSKVQGKDIVAYSIGLKGNDVQDENQFQANLKGLASKPENIFRASNMEEVNAIFQTIAEQLYNTSTSQTIRLTIPGQSNGTKIRFTFDDVADASLSKTYIEGVFSLQDRTLKDVTYSAGMTCGSGTTVAGVQDGIFVTFSFVDMKLESGEFVPTGKIQQWNYVSTAGLWQRNSEFTPENNTETTVERKSAAILLALDCSSSLGADFQQLKNHAKDFITKLAENAENSTGGGNGGGNGNGGGYVGDEIDIFSNLSYDEMVFVEGGTFLMGAQATNSPSYDWQGVQTANSLNYDSDASSHESPVHEVTLSSYYIGKYEVTQGLWEYVMNYSGKAADGTQLSPVGPYFGSSTPSSSYGVGTDYPVYYISYTDVTNYFLPRLNKITGKNFRLPTEAEWEYAARGGQKDEYTRTHTSLTPTIYSTGTYCKYAGGNTVGDVAWHYGNSGSQSHPVGTKAPNALGLYDMSGNLYEWCSDWYGSSYYSNSAQTNPQGPASGSNRVMRGGGWNCYAQDCRVSRRVSNTPGYRNFPIGLRLALGL